MNARALAAEGLGTGLLVCAVVGSGIMAQRLAGGDVALALLANTIATGAALVSLIWTFGPISGARFNPAVTLVLDRWRLAVAAEIAAQVVGGVAGAALAEAMFGEPLVALASTARTGGGQWLGEFVATFGLVGVILSTSRRNPAVTPIAVACWIVGAYWFTSSTSFANPAVTIARAFTDTFAGIRPADVGPFVAAQAAGAFAAARLFGWLVPPGVEER